MFEALFFADQGFLLAYMYVTGKKYFTNSYMYLPHNIIHVH